MMAYLHKILGNSRARNLVLSRTLNMNVVLTAALSIVIVLLFLYYVTTRKFNYWRKKNVPFAKPLPLFGNYLDFILQRRYTSEVSQELCRQFPDEPYFGTFLGTEPALMIQDPEIIKLVMTKDFYYFHSREVMDYTHREMITQNLFFTSGDRWKVFRQGFSPLFSSGKMKNMFYLINNCAKTFEDMLDYEIGKSEIIDVKNMMIRYTTDCICSCSFGINVKTMEKNPVNNTFLKMGQVIFGHSIIRGFLIVGRQIWPSIFYGLGLKIFPSEVQQFFHKILVNVFEGRGHQPSQRHDFVDLVLSLKKDKFMVGDRITNLKTGASDKIKMEVTDELLIPQCMVFFAAGFETSAGALSMTIFELAKNQEAQRRAQQEVDEFLKRHNNELVYDCVTELPYLNACLYETMRLYPVIPVITREAVEDYQFPTGLTIERGTRVHLPVYHLHRHPDHFPDPEEYKPERFLPEAKHTIKSQTFFPFGEGPRSCMGKRFAKMQIFPGLITFLKKYDVTLAKGTPKTFPYQTTTLVLQPACELPVRVTLREG